MWRVPVACLHRLKALKTGLQYPSVITPLTLGCPGMRAEIPDCSGPSANMPLKLPTSLILGPVFFKPVRNPCRMVLNDFDS